jgi:putative oxygen-independent coproporphyrinogen III oxidase
VPSRSSQPGRSWFPRCIPSETRAAAINPTASGEATSSPLSLYVHIPWCVRKCPYCDFNSHSVPESIPEAAYVEALLGDLDRDLAGLGQAPPPLVAVFIGGGTPSLFSGSAIARLLAGVRQRLPLDPTTEITLEANPGTADAANFAAYREAGVNRLSLGVQSLSADRLRDLGRIHGPGEARRAFRLARQAGFDNINLDLMYGLPHQNLLQAREDLALALALEPEHLSYYQLTLEPNTPFHATPPPLPDDDLGADMQLQGLELLSASGFAQYEVSAHARSGRQCRHNLNYWTFGDYIGIGAGAHAKRGDPATGRTWRQAKPRQPAAYLQAVGSPDPVGSRWMLQDEDLVLEFAMNALRLTEGFDRRRFTQRTGLDLDRLAAPLASAVGAGLLETRGHWVRPTERGRWFLNDLLEHFMPD